MTYNVFGMTLNVAQSINQLPASVRLCFTDDLSMTAEDVSIQVMFHPPLHVILTLILLSLSLCSVLCSIFVIVSL